MPSSSVRRMSLTSGVAEVSAMIPVMRPVTTFSQYVSSSGSEPPTKTPFSLPDWLT